MIYTFAGRGLNITDEIREYAEQRFQHAERLIGRQKTEPLLQSELEFHSGEAAAPFVVRTTLDVAHQPSLHVEARGTTMHEAVDHAAQALISEAEKIKGKRMNIRRHASKIKDFLRGLAGS